MVSIRFVSTMIWTIICSAPLQQALGASVITKCMDQDRIPVDEPWRGRVAMDRNARVHVRAVVFVESGCCKYF